MVDDLSIDDVVLDFFVVVVNCNFEICIVIDKFGVFFVWVFENVCSEMVSKFKIFDVVQIKLQYFEFFGFLLLEDFFYIEIQIFCDKLVGILNILLYLFDGWIGVFVMNVVDFFDLIINDCWFLFQMIWVGYFVFICKVVCNYSGRVVVLRMVKGESIVWKYFQKMNILGFILR